MKRHLCSQCGLLHNAPKASGFLVTFGLLAFMLPVLVLAALALDGWLAACTWALVGLQSLNLVVILGSLSYVATHNLTGEVTK